MTYLHGFIYIVLTAQNDMHTELTVSDLTLTTCV